MDLILADCPQRMERKGGIVTGPLAARKKHQDNRDKDRGENDSGENAQ
jgi:hypothetical protein